MDLRLKHEIESECRKLLFAYGRNLDEVNGEGLAELFASDGVWDRQGVVHRSRDEIRKTVRGREPNLVMRNIITNIVITVIDPLHAESHSYYSSYRHDAPGLGPDDLPRPMTSAAYVGEYINKFVRAPEGWRIVYHKANRIFRSEPLK